MNPLEIEELKNEKKVVDEKLVETEKQLKRAQNLLSSERRNRKLSADLEKVQNKNTSVFRSLCSLPQKFKCAINRSFSNENNRYSQCSEVETFYDQYEVKE